MRERGFHPIRLVTTALVRIGRNEPAETVDGLAAMTAHGVADIESYSPTSDAPGGRRKRRVPPPRHSYSLVQDRHHPARQRHEMLALHLHSLRQNSPEGDRAQLVRQLELVPGRIANLTGTRPSWTHEQEALSGRLTSARHRPVTIVADGGYETRQLRLFNARHMSATPLWPHDTGQNRSDTL